MRPKIFIRILFVILLAGSVAASGCSGLSQKTVPTATPEPVRDFSPVVTATGIVLPVQWSQLSMKASGVIAEVTAGEGETVEAGQVLVRLEGQEDLQAMVSAAEYEVTLAQRAMDDLYQDLDLRQAQFLKAIADSRDAVRDAERYLFNLQTRSQQVDIDAAYANMILAKDRLKRAREDYKPYEKKPEDNPVRAARLSRLAQAQKDYDALERRYNNLLGTAGEIDLAQAQADLAMAQAQHAKAERDYELLQQGPDPEDVALAEARLANAKAQLAAAQSIQETLELRAPFAGTLTEVRIHLDEWVSPGQPVLLLGDLSRLRVETTDLNEIDAARVEVGDPATVTFDALPDVSVQATVIRIAPKSSEGSGVNYTVVVELAEVPEKLRWGMTAFVDIEVE